MHMKGEPMAGKENREIKNSVFVDLFYEDESAEANEIALFNAIHDEPLPEGTKIRRRASVYGQRKHAPSESAVYRTCL